MESECKVFTACAKAKTVTHVVVLISQEATFGNQAEMLVNSTLAVSNIRNRTYTNCEVYLIDYGYGNFKEKIHFME